MAAPLKLWIMTALIVAVIYVLLVLFLLSIKLADGHEAEQWINDKGLRDPVSQQWCCGPNDCAVLSDGEVSIVRGGYQVGGQFIAEGRALPFAPDGHYHRCSDADGTVRCLIVPPPPS